MYKRHDWVLFTVITILSIIGLFTLLSTNIGEGDEIILSGVVSKQAGFMLVGLIIYFAVSLIDYTNLRFMQVQVPIYLVTIGLLASVLLVGPIINNVQRWIIVAGVQVQPSEIAKVSLILLAGGVMSSKLLNNDLLRAITVFLLALPVLALIYIEPHGSMTIISTAMLALTLFTFLSQQKRNIILIIIILLIVSGILSLAVASKGLIGAAMIAVGIVLSIYSYYANEEWRKLVIIALAISVVAGSGISTAWNNDKILKDYQKQRIETFFNPEEVDADDEFNVRQSQIAIGSGGIFGKGFGFGTQSRLNFLPEHQTDFIFATFAEQYGFFGSVILISLYVFLIGKLFFLSMSMAAIDKFAAIILFGLGIKLLFEVFINIGTNTGIIPATGIPLPLMSAGGTNVLMTFFSFGLIQSIITHRDSDPTTADYSINDVDREDLLI